MRGSRTDVMRPLELLHVDNERLHAIVVLQMPEEEAFAVLVKLMQDYKMRDMYKPTMAELGLCMYQLENLVQVQRSLSLGPSLPSPRYEIT
jgi:hypothetical protein